MPDTAGGAHAYERPGGVSEPAPFVNFIDPPGRVPDRPPDPTAGSPVSDADAPREEFERKIRREVEYEIRAWVSRAFRTLQGDEVGSVDWEYVRWCLNSATDWAKHGARIAEGLAPKPPEASADA